MIYTTSYHYFTTYTYLNLSNTSIYVRRTVSMVLMDPPSLPATTTEGTEYILISTTYGSAADKSTLLFFQPTLYCTVDLMFMTHVAVVFCYSWLPCTGSTTLYYPILPSQNTRLFHTTQLFFLVGWSASGDVRRVYLGVW